MDPLKVALAAARDAITSQEQGKARIVWEGGGWAAQLDIREVPGGYQLEIAGPNCPHLVWKETGDPEHLAKRLGLAVRQSQILNREHDRLSEAMAGLADLLKQLPLECEAPAEEANCNGG